MDTTMIRCVSISMSDSPAASRMLWGDPHDTEWPKGATEHVVRDETAAEHAVLRLRGELWS